jgi:hypothetical protein
MEGEKTELIKIQKVIEKESGKILPLINPIILKVYSDQPNLIYPLKLVKVRVISNISTFKGEMLNISVSTKRFQ